MVVLYIYLCLSVFICGKNIKYKFYLPKKLKIGDQTMDLKGKMALITGGNRGIGLAVAEQLARHGVGLFLVARDMDKLKQVQASFSKYQVPVEICACDLNLPESVETLNAVYSQSFHRLDFIINNAGIALSKSMETTSLEDWDRVMNLNARTPFFLTQKFLPLLRASTGRVINIASVVAHKGYIQQSVYTASKHALLGWSKALAREVQGEGLRVHVVCPGGVATEMVTAVRPDINTGELIGTDEIAEWVLFLLSREGNGVVDEISVRRASKVAWD